jgi:hypothetical protein
MPARRQTNKIAKDKGRVIEENQRVNTAFCCKRARPDPAPRCPVAAKKVSGFQQKHDVVDGNPENLGKQGCE